MVHLLIRLWFTEPHPRIREKQMLKENALYITLSGAKRHHRGACNDTWKGSLIKHSSGNVNRPYQSERELPTIGTRVWVQTVEVCFKYPPGWSKIKQGRLIIPSCFISQEYAGKK